jgi:hypothetical protein
MAVINVTSGSQAVLTLGNSSTLAEPDNTSGFAIPLVQDVSVSTQPGTVRYSTLDSTSSSAFTTVMENEISFNMLLDDDTFFGNSGITDNTVASNGLWSTSNSKTEINFSIAFEGDVNGSGGYYLEGSGFIGGLSPSASIEQAVWISPGTIIVNGDLTKQTL